MTATSTVKRGDIVFVKLGKNRYWSIVNAVRKRGECYVISEHTGFWASLKDVTPCTEEQAVRFHARKWNISRKVVRHAIRQTIKLQKK